MNISERILDLLRQQGKKQKDLSDFTGISTSAISAWNKNGAQPSSDKLPLIAEFLSVPLEYLVTGRGSGSKVESYSSENKANVSAEVLRSGKAFEIASVNSVTWPAACCKIPEDCFLGSSISKILDIDGVEIIEAKTR